MRIRSTYGHRLLIFLLLLLPLNQAVCATEMLELNLGFACGRLFFNSPDEEPFAAKTGQYRVPDLTSIITLDDGQCFIKFGNFEVRLKQETILAITDRHSLELRRGLAGFKADSELLKLKTAHLALEFSNALVVVKANPVMTRVCVVKGSAVVTQGRQLLNLKAGQEIAAAPQRLSKTYQQSDELRFTWYWVEPEKEPALQNSQL